VLVEGRLKFETWEKDGRKRSKLSVVADRVVMLGQPTRPSRSTDQSSMRRAEPAAAATGHDGPSYIADDDIPF
jgi:single-strand DNA-binding protein